MKLAIFSSKLIQYKSPLYRYLAAQPGLEVMVYYYSAEGLPGRGEPHDSLPGGWDTPLLDDYSYQFLNNWLDVRGWKWNAFSPYFNPQVIRKLQANHFDALLIHSYQFPSDWLAWAAGKLSNTRVIFYGEMERADRPGRFRRAVRRIIHRTMIRGSDACLAVSSAARAVFEGEFQVAASQVFDAPYSVDNDFFIQNVEVWRARKAQHKQELGISPDQPVVLYVSRMVEGKGFADLVEAVRNAQTPAQLILVGYGPLENEIRSLCRQILPETIVTGFVNQTELPRYYAIADIFVHPSHHESFGVVINEAMCAGLPVLASTGVAAALDLVQAGVNGEFFQPGDINELGTLLAVLLADDDKLRRYGWCSSQIISSWGIDRTAVGIQAALNFVTGSHSGVS